MENPTQALILALALALVACKPGAVRSETPKEPSIPAWVQGSPAPDTGMRPAKPEPAKIPLGEGLYVDSAGVLYLKVWNRGLRHPSQDNRPWPDSIYLSRVYLDDQDSLRSLADVVDRATFAKENAQGTYFSDANRLYAYSVMPRSNQFNSMPRKGSEFMGGKKEYLLQQDALYWEGVKVEGLDNKRLAILRINLLTGGDFLEFITDGRKRIFFGKDPLDSARLHGIGNISDKDRRKLDKLMRNQPPPLE